MSEPIATIRSYPELVEAFRMVKAMRRLSNKWCDDTCELQDGYTDKVLGPTGSRGISPILFSMFCQIFAVKFIMEVDVEAAAKMQAHWEERSEGKVAFPESRMSKALLAKAKPLVIREIGRIGGIKRASQLSAKHARQKGGKRRMRKLSKKERVALARMASCARWNRKEGI